MRSVKVKTRDLCVALLFLFTATIVSCYAVNVSTGTVSSDFFTISLAFQFDPGRAIATFGLPLIGFFGYAVLLGRILYEPEIKAPGEWVHSERLLKWAHRFAAVCPIGFIGVAAITLSYDVIGHSFFASALFIFEGLACILLAIEDYHVIYRSFNSIVIFRISLIIIGTLSLACMGLGQLYSLIATSVGEVVFAICAITFVLSYSKELAGYSLEVQLIKT